jgi:hypothetical protein
MLDQLFHEDQAGAGRPRRKRRLVGQARAREALAQVGELRVRNVQPEGLWRRQLSAP